ncbi:MAG: hypothetical protein HZA93_00655 [Verrucomicrobia bacterium]|nr:hypothetical protein [Verrucomicrobiota bacterium]
MKPDPSALRRWLPLLARLALGAMFVHLGVVKALDPVGFLKLVRQFDLVTAPLLLNFTAAVLPWVEIFCGGLLLLGVRTGGTALLALVLLMGFTGAVALRAWALSRTGSLPFCALRFDCGCGTGEVAVCAKLLQNAGLIVLAGSLFIPPPPAKPAA